MVVRVLPGHRQTIITAQIHAPRNAQIHVICARWGCGHVTRAQLNCNMADEWQLVMACQQLPISIKRSLSSIIHELRC